MSDKQRVIGGYGEMLKVYMTDAPRAFGLFHLGLVGDATPGAVDRAGIAGLIYQIGPCKCGNPTHKYPQYYSATPCVYFILGVKIITVRVPWLVSDALRWLSGS